MPARVFFSVRQKNREDPGMISLDNMKLFCDLASDFKVGDHV
jgi:hypothetical protein